MKRALLILALVLFGTALRAQTDAEPALWSHEVHKLSETRYQLVFKGKIMDGWHIYSQYTAAGGSLPSEFSFEGAGEEYRLLGEAGRALP